MPDIVLKNILGQDVTYTGIDTVKLKNTAGGEETFSHGIAVEDVPIELDLANGETQTIYAPDGTLVKSAVVSITGGGGGDAVEMEETELPFVESNGAYQTLLPITRLFLNATYTVVWNGTEYTCTCKAMEFADSLILTLGNAVFLGGEATGEPFLIAQLPDMVGCITAETNATNTVSLALNFDSGGDSGEESASIVKSISKIVKMTGSAVNFFTPDELRAAGIDPAEIENVGYTADAKNFVLISLVRLTPTNETPPSSNYIGIMVTSSSPIYYYNGNYAFSVQNIIKNINTTPTISNVSTAKTPFSTTSFGLSFSGGYVSAGKSTNHYFNGTYVVTLNLVSLQ